MQTSNIVIDRTLPLGNAAPGCAFRTGAATGINETLLDGKGLTEAGRRHVIETGISLPARKVGRKRRRHNLILEVPIPSLGLVLQAESLTGEYAFLVRLQRRTDLEFAFDQPITVGVEIVNILGRPTRTTYTADYLLVEVARVCAVEIKTDSELRELVRDRSSDWTFDGERYHYLPAERYFARLGIHHEVIPISELSPLVTVNLQFLSACRKLPDTRQYRRARRGILTLLERARAVRIGDVMDRMETEDSTPFLQLIDQGLAFVDLERVALSEIRDVWLSSDVAMARIAQQSTQRLRELFLAAGAEMDGAALVDPRYELDVATTIALIEGTTSTNSKGIVPSLRTLQRYRKNYNPADPRSVQKKYANCGSDSALHTNHVALIQGCVREYRSDPKHPSTGQAFREYKERFKNNRDELEIPERRAVARSTFYDYWAKTPTLEGEAYSKGGRRLSNAEEDATDPFKKSLFGTRAFEVAHIDHWKADFHLVVAIVNGKRITKRPWLTCMVDMHTGEVLAFWLSFKHPSRRACTMVIRDCVRRHGRLPEILVVDGGAEFKSAHFLVMLATLVVIRAERPPEDPRYGKEVERVFGQFKERFAKGLPGFGISIEKARAVSGAFKAPRSATLTLMDATEVLDAWIFNGFNHMPKPGTSIFRSDLREQALRQFPFIGVPVTWDLKFLIATSIAAPGADYTLWKGKGIHLLDKWYSSPALLRFRGYKKDFVVRCEPFCDSVIYVRIEGKWLVCARQDVTLQLAMTDRRLISLTCERHELSALRREIQNDADTAAAAIVNEKLAEIAARTDTKEDQGRDEAECEEETSSPPTRAQTPQNEELDEETGVYLPFTFDQIEGLTEEP